MSLRQKVGQMLIFGYSGTTAEGSLERIIRNYRPGAIITFSRNITSFDQIRDVNKRAQVWAQAGGGIPLLIMVDQEGGNVSRLRVHPGLPSALALGETKNLDLVEKYGTALGHLMGQLGFNMNLAPVLDLSDPTKLSFIGPRSFGVHPERVGQMTTAFARGLSLSGVIPTAKHFPGHGGVVQDSHRVTPQKLSTLEELINTDLVPFKRFASSPFPRAVMMAHIAYPQIDPSGAPAAFSETFIEDILRQKFKFDGLIITDDVEMSGANIAGSVEERVIRAVEAGNDMVMIAWSAHRQARAFRSLLAAVRAGRIQASRIDQSVRRILSYKQAIRTPKPATQINIRHHLLELAEKVKRFNFLQSATPQTKLRGLLNTREPVTVFASDYRFFEHFKKRYGAGARFIHLAPDSQDQLEEELQQRDDRSFIFYASGIQTARWLNQLTSTTKRRLIVVNTNQAGAIENRQNYLGVFQMNTLAPEAGRWLAEYLTEPRAQRKASL